jgi:hypothetical protein
LPKGLVRMNLVVHTIPGGDAAEITTDEIIVTAEKDTILLMEEMFPTGAHKIILHRENLAPEFFDLRTGLAGAVLQKFMNYQIRVAIIGDFSQVTSKSLSAFIYESNRGSSVAFVPSLDAALQKLGVN